MRRGAGRISLPRPRPRPRPRLEAAVVVVVATPVPVLVLVVLVVVGRLVEEDAVASARVRGWAVRNGVVVEDAEEAPVVAKVVPDVQQQQQPLRGGG